MLKRLFLTFIIILILIAATTAIVAFGRGYRFDIGKKEVTSTGILAVASFPEGASIFINGRLTSATNNSINIPPGRYDLKIVKEGYISWQKRIVVKGEIVTKVDVLLIPLSPSLRPLTILGVLSPVLSPSGNQLAYIIPFDATVSSNVKTKAGIWVWNLKEGSLLPIGSGPKILARSAANLDLSHAQLLWSPDEKQLLALFFKDNLISTKTLTSAYRLDTSLSDQTPIASLDSLSSILADWQLLQNDKEKTIISSLPPSLSDALKENVANILLSADENKIMYAATASATIPLIITPPLIGTNTTPEDRNIKPGNIYIYDIKEDKNFFIRNLPSTPSPKPSAFPSPSLSPISSISPTQEIISLLSQNSQPVQWYPDSKHILMLENGTIYITEYDGQNKTTVYAGPLEDSYVFPWPGGGRILILTSYNRAASQYPNLYAVDIR